MGHRNTFYSTVKLHLWAHNWIHFAECRKRKKVVLNSRIVQSQDKGKPKKNQTDSTRQRNKVPFGLRASVSANKLNECRAAFCLAAVFLWCVLNHRNIVNQKSWSHTSASFAPHIYLWLFTIYEPAIWPLCVSCVATHSLSFEHGFFPS